MWGCLSVLRPDLKGEANLKRGINGIYHQVSKQHLYRYLTELDLRYNTRKIKDGERTLIAVKQAGGKRLKLRDSCAQRPF